MSAHHNEKRFRCCDISGFRHEVDYFCALMGHYAEYSSNSLQKFRETYRLFQTLFVSVVVLLDLVFFTGHVNGNRRSCQNTNALFHGHFHRSFLVHKTKSPVNIWVHSNMSALKRNNGVLGSAEQWLSVNMNTVQPTIQIYLMNICYFAHIHVPKNGIVRCFYQYIRREIGKSQTATEG